MKVFDIHQLPVHIVGIVEQIVFLSGSGHCVQLFVRRILEESAAPANCDDSKWHCWRSIKLRLASKIPRELFFPFFPGFFSNIAGWALALSDQKKVLDSVGKFQAVFPLHSVEVEVSLHNSVLGPGDVSFVRVEVMIQNGTPNAVDLPFVIINNIQGAYLLLKATGLSVLCMVHVRYRSQNWKGDITIRMFDIVVACL